MIDKITTVHRSILGQLIGKASTTEMLQIERALLVFLGMTGWPTLTCPDAKVNAVLVRIIK